MRVTINLSGHPVLMLHTENMISADVIDHIRFIIEALAHKEEQITIMKEDLIWAETGEKGAVTPEEVLSFLGSFVRLLTHDIDSLEREARANGRTLHYDAYNVFGSKPWDDTVIERPATLKRKPSKSNIQE